MGYTPERSKIDIILGLKARKDIIFGLNSVRLGSLIFFFLYCTFWIYYCIYLIRSFSILITVIIGLFLILYETIHISSKHLKITRDSQVIILLDLPKGIMMILTLKIIKCIERVKTSSRRLDIYLTT